VATGLVLAATLGMLLSGRVQTGIVGVFSVVALAATGVLAPDVALRSLGHESVVAVGAMFVISAAISRTGALDSLVGAAVRIGRRPGGGLLAWLVVVPALASSVLSNTAVVLIFIPIVLAICERLDDRPSRYLIPLSYASILGGCLTLVGTSTHLVSVKVAEGAAKSLGVKPPEVGMFTFAPLGAVFLVVGLVYLLTLGRRILPDRVAIAPSFGDETVDYVTEVEIGKGSRLAGRRLAEFATGGASKLKLLQIVREDIVQTPLPDMIVAEGDLLVLKGTPDEILMLRRDRGTRVLPGLDDSGDDVEAREVGVTLAEVMVSPNSSWLGRRVREIGMRRKHGVSVIAVQRHGRHVRATVDQIPLGVGDTILVQGSVEALRRLRTSADLVLIEGVDRRVVDRSRAPIALAGIVAFVIGAALFTDHIAIVALGAAAALTAARCLTAQEAAYAPDWNVLLLLGGSIALGDALVRTGLAEQVALEFSRVAGDSPRVQLAAMYLATLVLTEFLSNGAAAALMMPIALASSARLGVDATPFMMAVAFGASCAFALPMGYQTHLFVYGIGGYRMRDFVFVGVPLDILLAGTATLLLPVFYPL
jgi:di/tricarboxylate transporter